MSDIKDDIIYKAALTFKHEELAGMYAIINKREQEYLKEIKLLKEENARLREALEFYADRNNWETIETSHAELVKTLYPEDYGDIARKALERGRMSFFTFKYYSENEVIISVKELSDLEKENNRLKEENAILKEDLLLTKDQLTEAVEMLEKYGR